MSLLDKASIVGAFKNYQNEREERRFQEDLIRQQQAENALWNVGVLPGQVFPEQVLTGAGTISNGGVTTAVNPCQQVLVKHPQEVNPKDVIKLPAMQASIDDLENLWAAKFGSEWVTGTDLHDTGDYTFWDIACRRLAKADRLEEFDIVKSYQVVYRLCK